MGALVHLNCTRAIVCLASMHRSLEKLFYYLMHLITYLPQQQYQRGANNGKFSLDKSESARKMKIRGWAHRMFAGLQAAGMRLCAAHKKFAPNNNFESSNSRYTVL